VNPLLVLLFIGLYFGVLIAIARLTANKGDNASFFLGNRRSPWPVVAFGMVGASLSGVTFISVPGWVATSQFSYFQMVLGYVPGYLVVAFVLLPLYYRLNLTSIYTYLEGRFGPNTYKTGAWFFLVSRMIGSAFRLYLVAIVLQTQVFDRMGVEVPFAATVLLTIALIWLYTARGGIKTIIWTDMLQTAFMLIAVGISVYAIARALGLDVTGVWQTVESGPYSRIFFLDDPNDERFFLKQFLAGMFITITMTGLDQDMMQKNLSCRNLRDAQKNMLSFTVVLVGVNLLFLSLGALLYTYGTEQSIRLPDAGDQVFPMLAMDGYLGAGVGVLFVLGLIAAAYSSADSALTALTTSFSVDIMGVQHRDERAARRLRRRVHIGVSLVMVVVILVFKAVNNESVIKQIFTVAGYTYGPLLGLYTWGLFTKKPVRDRLVPVVAVLSPLLSWAFAKWAPVWFGGYKVGFELLLINAAITIVGLWVTAPRIRGALHP
jgi:SSS family transporter